MTPTAVTFIAGFTIGAAAFAVGYHTGSRARLDASYFEGPEDGLSFDRVLHGPAGQHDDVEDDQP